MPRAAGDPRRFFETTALRDCSGARLGQDEFFGVLLYKAPQEALTARRVEASWREFLGGARSRATRGRLHAYIHIPFCAARCTYCLYYSEKIARSSQIDEYLESRVFKEMKFFSGAFKGAALDYLAVGGGTPSLLTAKQLERLMARFHASYALRKGALTVFECNPRSVTPEKMRLLKALGITRISIGVQSLDPAVLKRVNRGYQTDEMTRRAIRTIQEAGFRDGLNIDLIAGFAGESVGRLLGHFEAIAKLDVDSIHVNLLHAVGPKNLPGPSEGVAAAPEARARIFAELARRLPPFAERLGLVFRPLTGPLTLQDEDWCFARPEPGGSLRPHSYGRNDEDDIRLPLLNNSVLAFGPEGRSRVAGRLLYWDQRTTASTPFSPDAPSYQGYKIDRGFEPLWRLMIALREKTPGSDKALRALAGAEAVAMVGSMHRLAGQAAAARRRKAPGPVCLCQIGGCLAGDGRWLDFSELFGYSVSVETGAGRLGFKLRKEALSGSNPLCRAHGLALELFEGPSDPAARSSLETKLIAEVAAVFAAVAARQAGQCLAETIRLLQRALAARLGVVFPGRAPRVGPPEVRSFMAERHVLKCLL